jgi:hypothetical protein
MENWVLTLSSVLREVDASDSIRLFFTERGMNSNDISSYVIVVVVVVVVAVVFG